MIREALRLLWLAVEDALLDVRAGDIGKPERIIEAPEPVPETLPATEPVHAPAEPVPA